MIGSIQYRIRLAWWLRVYLQSVVLASLLTGREPDIDKVGYWIKKGLKLEPVR